MLPKIKRLLTLRMLFLTGGLAVVLLAAFLIWAGLTARLHDRLPVPSPDGKYFAYFALTRDGFSEGPSRYDLIVSTRQGRMMARFPMNAGTILWSNAGHLAVVNEGRSEVTLFPNVGGRFLLLPSFSLSRGAQLRWSRDGNKLAYVRPGSAGDEMAIYDLQQTQAFAVTMPADFRLRQPMLLFWSPISEQLFFLNDEGAEVVLQRVDLLSGELQVIARGTSGWKGPVSGHPRMSPDGTNLYLPPPVHAVVDARTRETIWLLPAEARVLWTPWSADGTQLFYSRAPLCSEIYAHDFSSQTDQMIVSRAQPKGFFAVDRRSYFFRDPQAYPPGGVAPGLRDWLETQRGWQHVDVVTQSAQPLGRMELWPWEQTRDGLILARRDDYTRVKFGLYDPNVRLFGEYVFPTAGQELFQAIKSQGVILLAVLLYAFLAFLVYSARPESSPARAFYLLSMILMSLFASMGVLNLVMWPPGRLPYRVPEWEITALGWWPPYSLSSLVFDRALAFLLLSELALIPPALLHFAIVFPEGNQFLAKRKVLRSLLYGAAFLPLTGLLVMPALHRAPEVLKPVAGSLLVIAGPLVVITALLSLLSSYRHPPDRRARDQVRWVAMAFVLPLVGLGALGAINALVSFSSRLVGKGPQQFLDMFNTATLATLCLFTPLAVGYALVAHKLFDIHLLIRRTVRYTMITFVVAAVYFLIAGGLSWAIAGFVENPSQPVVILSTLLTALIIAPVRTRLQSFIDRTFDRTEYDFREALQNFADSLAGILDRATLATRLSETVERAMKARRFHLFVLDRRTGRLRPQLAAGEEKAEVASVEFDPAEPLCRYLLEEQRPFEVEVSPYDPKLIPIFRSAAERLSQLEAAVVFGLERRKALVGLMVAGVKSSDEFYNAEDLGLLMTVARQAAVAVENTELFEEIAQDRELKKELEVASEVQAHLFPSVLPRVTGCQIAWRCLPARSVSGDYYDFLELPGQKIGLAVGDVSGKGLSASLLMANLQGLLRTQAPTAESSAELVRRINGQVFVSSRGAKYCTFFYGVYDEALRRLEFVNAGHNPPLLLNASGTRFLESTGVPLGLFQEVNHDTRSEQLEPGTLLALYSDGITEARNEQGELYGVDRLVNALSRARDSDLASLIEKVLAEVRDFSAGAPVEDDQTLVLLRVNRV